MGLSQPAQCDGGLTTDSPRGTRQITTLRNEPTIRPSTLHTTISGAVMPVSYRIAWRLPAGTRSADVLALVEDVGGVADDVAGGHRTEHRQRNVGGVSLVG